jgi:hypothetical protein
MAARSRTEVEEMIRDTRCAIRDRSIVVTRGAFISHPATRIPNHV